MMEKKTKKLIAREFLIMLFCTIVFLIFAMIIDYKGKLNYDKTGENNQKLAQLENRLGIFTYKDKFFTYSMLLEKYGENIQVAIDRFGFVEVDNAKTDEELTDSEKLAVIRNMKNIELEIEKLKNSIFRNSSHYILVVFWIIIILAYGLRPLFYAVKWSIRELKE